ncbi:DNRLRE domain-containing protein [bacterium]|nr:DNRLRE domain-containing protein [bacterium]
MVFRTSIVAFVLVLITLLGGMPAGAATYYVATDSGASNSNTGTQDKPWRTIAYAASKAMAGDTVMIKAGNYGNEHVVVANFGTGESKRIVFEGYGGKVQLGVLPSPRTLPADTEVGFKIKDKNYITLRNLNFTWYFDCVYIENSDYVTCENLYIDKCGSKDWLGHGIVYTSSNNGKILGCTVIDCGGNNMSLRHSNDCLIDNLKTLGTLAGSNTYATDYYCVLVCCSGCTVQNSRAEDQVDSDKGNHGFIIKDLSSTPHSHDNLIKDCVAISFEECFSAAHLAYKNTFLRCYGDNSAKTNRFSTVLQARNGAYNNTFKECGGVGSRALVSLTSYDEGNVTNKDGNKFINCRLRGTGLSGSRAIVFGRTTNSVFQNCVFEKVTYLARWVNGTTNTGNSIKNSIIAGMQATYDPYDLDPYPYGTNTPYDGTSALTVTYSDFWSNSFPAFGGSGNMSADPKFANQAGGDYHLKSKAGRWNGTAWVYDTEDSPCIDKGDQSSSYTNEPAPNGGRINIGGYGNTAEASKSSSGNNGPASPYDNRLCERYPTTVYPSNAFLDAGHLASTINKSYRDLIWFDLSPYSGSVKKATLSLCWYYPTSSRTNSTVVDIYRPAYGWNHDYACWNNKANGVAWTHAGGDWYDKNGTAQGSTPYASVTFNATQAATNQYYAFDVTALVNEYLKSGQNAGFFIKARTESDNYIAFDGLAATDSATLPKLEVVKANDAATWAVYQ